MHDEYKLWRGMMAILIGLLILNVTWNAYLEKGLIMAFVFLLASLAAIIFVSVTSVVVAAWIGYFAGFHKKERLSGWRIVLAFLLMPVGWFAIPVAIAIPTNLLAPMVPGPMAEELPTPGDT